MLDWLHSLFSASGFMPHIHCYLGRPDLVWTMFATDLLIGISYVGISITLWTLVRRIRIPFNVVVVCFGVFILACGVTHFTEIWTLWRPNYWIAAWVKVVTAIASIGTGIYLFRLRHRILEFAESAKLSEQRRFDLEALAVELKGTRDRLEQIIHRSLGRMATMEEILLDIIDAAIEIAHAEFGFIQLLDPETQELRIIVQRGFPESWPNCWNRLVKKKGVCRSALDSGTRVIVEDLLAKPPLIDPEVLDMQKSVGIRSVQSTPLANRSGQALGTFSTHRKSPGAPAKHTLDVLDTLARLAADTIEQSQLRRRLGESEEKYSALFRSSPFAAVLVEMPLGIITETNDEFLRMFEIPREQVVGKEYFERPFLEHEIRNRVQTMLDQSGQVRDLEFSRSARSGAQKLLSLNVDQVQILEKKQLLATIRDITERRDKEIAEQANRAQEAFLAVLSHELRTPLTAILSWAEILGKGEVNKTRLLRGLEVIKTNAQAQGQLINDVLDVSRINSGKLSLSLQAIVPDQIIREVVEMIQPEAEKKMQKIYSDLPRLDGTLCGDPVRMKQVLWNLLSNATKFTPNQGEIRVILEAINGRVRIRVSDNGRGFTPSASAKLFERFSQGDISTTRQFGGLGLGLTLVKSLTEMQGGAVWAESPGLDEGATFVVEFPLSKPNLGEPEGIEDLSAGGTLQAVRILLVDDEKSVGEPISHLLEDLGAIVEFSNSAKEACESLAQFLPDVLVSDIAMPFEDGYSLIRKIRATPANGVKNLPAIAMTAFTGFESRERAIEAGFTGYVMKPIDVASLAKKINQVLSETGQSSFS